MNYAKMSIADDQFFVKINGHIIADFWPVSSGKIELLIEQILNLAIEINGIIAVLPLKTNERLDISFKQLGKEFAEKINCPVVFCDEDELQISSVEEILQTTKWSLDYYGYEPGQEEYTTESLLTVGNGFIGLRGTMPEMKISDDHYPATYLAGLYNETKSTVADREITNEDLVNAPNFQYISICVDGEEITYSNEQVRELERHLDMRTGLFTARSVLGFQNGKEVLISVKKFVSMADRNLYALSYKIEPLNFSGEIDIISEGDGAVFNYNVERYRSLNQYHLIIDELSSTGNSARLTARTSVTDLTIIQESKLVSDKLLTWKNEVIGDRIRQQTKIRLKKGETVNIDKLVFIEKLMPTSKNSDISGLGRLTSFDEMFSESKAGWDILWQEADIHIVGDMMSEKMLRLHTYHLLVSASPLSAKDLDVSVTARGLHGEAYRGHIFWDELYIMPFYIMHFPQTAKEFLMYRYRRLKAAKDAAAAEGYRGAMYPWQSGLDGTEQSQRIHLNPMSGNWDPDNSSLQRHVSLAIAYNFWLYWMNTEDVEFMEEYGLEMLIEITIFWISKADYDNSSSRYSIAGVMGPDEFHEAYPGSHEGGLKDNAYTNMMVVWLFEELAKLLVQLPEKAVKKVRDKTGFTGELEASMKKIMTNLNLDIDEKGIIAQFSGYFDLKDINLETYREKYGDIHRMDRILKAEGRSPDEYRVAKQADTLMAFYNLDKANIDRIFSDLGYNLPQDYFRKNLEFYLARTSHGSTLSRVVHTKLAAMAGEHELSWEMYQESLYSDYKDIQGGTVGEGIHTGVMASTLYITMCTFGGIDIRENKLIIEPLLPIKWKELRFNLNRRGIHYELTIEQGKMKILSGREN